MIMSSNAFMTTIFCDDVRNEVGNKLSFIGTYGANIMLAALPATLPRLCAVMSLYLPTETKAELITFALYRDDEVIAQADTSLSALREIKPAPDDGEERRLTIQFIAQVSPLQLAGPCRLKARAVIDGEMIKGGSVSVEQAPEGLVP